MSFKPKDTKPPPRRPLDSHPACAQASFLSSTADIGPARDDLRAWLEANAPAMAPARIDDVLLVVSELFTNALRHGRGGCLLDMRRVQDDLALTVTNSATDPQILPPEWWQMPDVQARTGRGLAIVRKLADSVQLTTSKTSVSITVTFHLTTPSRPRTYGTTAVAV